MMIAQMTEEGKILPLEDLHKKTNIGKDTFTYGKILLESINDTCDILKGFTQLMKEYKIRNYRAVTTSGIREAANRDYVLEQIRVKSGLEVEVINSSQERFLMYKAIHDLLPDAGKIRYEGTLIVNIGSGGVEASVYTNGNLKFTEYVKVGSLRIRETLSDLEDQTIEFPHLVEEYIESKTYSLETLIRQRHIKNFIGLGGGLRSIFNLCVKNKADQSKKFIDKKSLISLYKTLYSMSTEDIMKKFNVSQSDAELMLPSVIIFKRFIEMTKAEGIYTPMVSLRHGVLADMADEIFDTARKQEALSDIISSVWYIGKKYDIDTVHASFVEYLALSVFDQTKRLHRLGAKERFYLQITAILHDIGRYVSLNQHHLHSFNIVRHQDIMGLSVREMEIIANVVFYHSNHIPNIYDESYNSLIYNDKMIVSKLAAILKLAECMDIAHKQKLSKIEISTSGNELIFKVISAQEILLEKRNFENNAIFFEEVMGCKPIIKTKIKME